MRVDARRVKGQNPLQANLQDPAVTEVVPVEEPFASVQSEIAEMDPKRVIREADSTQAGNAVRLPMNAELVQMGIAPA